VKNLRIGDTGPEVTALQHALNARGSSLTVTGEYDRATASCVMRFQVSSRLLVTAVWDEATQAAFGPVATVEPVTVESITVEPAVVETVTIAEAETMPPVIVETVPDVEPPVKPKRKRSPKTQG